MGNEFDLKPSFPISGVADLIASRSQKEAAMREQNQQQLVKGLQDFGSGVQSLVDRRNKMAQALTLGKNLGMAPEEVQGLDPTQVLQAATVKKNSVDMQTLFSLLHGTPPPAASPQDTGASHVSGPAGLVPVASTGGPMLTSNTTVTPMPDAGNSGSGGMTPPATGQVPVPIAPPPIRPKQVNKATADLAIKMALANKQEPVMTQDAALAAGSVPKGARIINPNQGNSDKKEQDAYWRESVRGLQSIRGDSELKNTEAQRTAAITSYNRLRDIEMTGKAPNPIDYIDILGQIYKARTGTAPSQEVLKEAKQQTATGQFGKAFTYFTGQQAPGTSKEIAASLKDMVAHMGLQADDLHDGFMQAHGSQVFNPNMSPENVAKLSKIARGKSFTEATGVKPEDYDPHVQAIKWAQSHPDDPRSASILQKAMQAQQGSGGQIAL